MKYVIDEHPAAKATLIFKGTRDGFGAPKFHQLCDNKGPTLTVVKSDQNEIFGGFTKASWGSKPDGYTEDASAFIYSVTMKQKCKVTKSADAIYCSPDRLVSFGLYDIDMLTDSNLNMNSDSKPDKYITPQKNGVNSTISGGNTNFKSIEIEVYQITGI